MGRHKLKTIKLCACGDPSRLNGLCPRCYRKKRDKRRPTKLCKHCQVKQSNRPRGLCWACYYSPEICRLYALEVKTSRPGISRRGPAPEPTDTPVDSEERIEVYRQRAAAGYNLHHPDDTMRYKGMAEE